MAACGNGEGAETTTAGAATTRVTCAGPPFDPAAFDAPVVDLERDRSAEVTALRDLSDEPFAPDARPWRQLGRSAEEVAFGAGTPPLLDAFVVLRRSDEGWRYAGSGGGCVVRPDLGGRASVRWGLQPGDIDPAAEALDVIANDEQCAGSVGAADRLDEPTVVETADAVVVTFTARAVDGNCPSHPPALVRVPLTAPIGDRRLLDGGIYPPQPPCRVVNGDCMSTAQELAERE